MCCCFTNPLLCHIRLLDTMTFSDSLWKVAKVSWHLSRSVYILWHLFFLLLKPQLHTELFPQPQIHSQSYQHHTRSPADRDSNAPMSTVPSNAIALKTSTKLPTIESLLIHAGSGSDECSLCGNVFDLERSAESIQTLPCMDDSCESCASAWRMLSSPMCSGCYGDFACPKVAKAQIQASSPKLQMAHVSSIPDMQMMSALSIQDRYVVLDRVASDSDDDSISDPGSPMKDDERNGAVSELGDGDLREALLVANNRVGTNFNIQEIGFETPLDHLNIGTKTQLADLLTELCTLTASESDMDESWDESSQKPEADDPSGTTNQQAQKTVQGNSRSCTTCNRLFYSSGHLRQHMAKHDIGPRTCKICGRVFSSPGNRRAHEQKHRETDSERELRLQKVAHKSGERSIAGR